MTNREWLESLGKFEFAEFLANEYRLPNGMVVGINNLKEQDVHGYYVLTSQSIRRWLEKEHVPFSESQHDNDVRVIGGHPVGNKIIIN